MTRTPPPAAVSMLGKLFSIGAGASGDRQDAQLGQASRHVSSLDSVQEDTHTRSLLFPDTQSLYLHRNDQVFPLSMTPSLPPTSMSNAFDYNGELDLETRDVRVLVMQDTLGSLNASLLFDSHPCPVAPASTSNPTHDPRRAPTSPRKPSLSQSTRPVVIQGDNPHIRQGAFDRRADSHRRSYSFAETDLQRATREYREELATFTSCIFGSSELMAYKGTSTKVHVVPTEQRTPEYSASVANDGRGSFGRSSMRSSKLAQSYSSEVVSPLHPPASFATAQQIPRAPERKKVLITRLFPVAAPTDDETAAGGSVEHRSPDETGNPAHSPDDAAAHRQRNFQPRQKRTPMYAVVLVIHLPPSPSSTSKSTFRGSGSFTDQDSFPSSFNSARRSGWTMVGSGHDSLDSSLPFDGDDQMDHITQHWDIIMRTLTHLQSVMATTLGSLLKQVDQASSSPYPNTTQQPVRVPPRRTDDKQPPKPPKSNSKVVALPPNALAHDPSILHHAQVSRVRIVTGLKAARVVTGQGRWGIWRDEARLTARSAGSADHDFLLAVLTGFLASHRDWLQALSPAWHRKRYVQQQKSKSDGDLTVPARTIIVSEDKMVARRIVFLLSAFLPAHQSLPMVYPHHASTSPSFGALSQSPPSVIVPIVREESLRRKMTRRTGPRRASHSRTVSQGTRASVPTQLAHLTMEGHHERRASDAASIRTMNLTIPYGESGNRKGIAASTTAIASDETVPHFSSVHRADSRRSLRPGSSSSFAAEDLRRSLQRGESAGQLSTASSGSRSQSSRWGSVISGFWNGARRRDSTNSIGDSSRPPLSPSVDMPSPSRRSLNPNKLAEMMRELPMPDPRTDERRLSQKDPETPRAAQQDREVLEAGSSSNQTRRWPEPGVAFDMQIKTTVNREDGVIDVDVPFPDYLTNPNSLDTAVSSPSSSGYLSTPGLGTVMDTFEQACRLAMEGDLPLNSAGWLQGYHPDFVLQAIAPQRDLIKEVKASLRAEPSPALVPLSPSDPSAEVWVDIGTAVIADMTVGRVRRIRYRRLIRPKHAEPFMAPYPGITPHSPAQGGVYGSKQAPSVLPYETTLQEEFIEDEITAPDSTLAEAVERVISHVGGDASKAASSSSSRSNSKPPPPLPPRPGDDHLRPSSRSSSVGPTDEAPRTPNVLHEVPRNECRGVILTALSDIIRDVMEKRAADDRADEEESAIRAGVKEWLESLEQSTE